MFNEIIDECKQLVLEVLPFHVLSTLLKHQIVDVNIQGLPNAKNTVVCTEFQMCSNFIFPTRKHIFPNILITEIKDYLIHYF